MTGGYRSWGKTLGLLVWLFGSACASAGSSEPAFSLLSGDVPGGILLSAWSDGEDLLAVGGQMGSGPGSIVHYDGSNLCYEHPAPAEHVLWWVHGNAPGHWYAVGENGTVLHSEEGVRSREDLPTTATLYGVWTGEEQVIAVGGDFEGSSPRGEVWLKRDGTWSPLSIDLPGVVFKVWENWLVGDGVAWRLDGDQLVEEDTESQRMVTIRGRGNDDVWAVGGWSEAIVMHRDASSWSSFNSTGLPLALNGLWTEPGETLWVAGMGGTMGYLGEDGAWVTPDLPPSSRDFHAVWKHKDEVLLVGGDMFAPEVNVGSIVRHGTDSSSLVAGVCP